MTITSKYIDYSEVVSKMNKILKMTTEKIRKYKPLKRVNLGRVKDEIARVIEFVRNPLSAEGRAYNIHNVPVGGLTYKVADAKIPNKETHQSGRGNLRYLIDKLTNQYVGLALELDSGEYRRVA